MCNVNYLIEIRRFNTFAARTRLPASAQLLWYKLIEIMNQHARGGDWCDGFLRIEMALLSVTIRVKSALTAQPIAPLIAPKSVTIPVIIRITQAFTQAIAQPFVQPIVQPIATEIRPISTTLI